MSHTHTVESNSASKNEIIAFISEIEVLRDK